MGSFAEHFSDEAIIAELCRARITLATKRHEDVFLHNIAGTEPPAHARQPIDWGKIPLDIFPPRRAWHRFRRKSRGDAQAPDLNFEALHRAVLSLRKQSPQRVWARKLEATVRRIRTRVLSKRPFRFQRPTILSLPKERGGHLYRPLG